MKKLIIPKLFGENSSPFKISTFCICKVDDNVKPNLSNRSIGCFLNFHIYELTVLRINQYYMYSAKIYYVIEGEFCKKREIKKLQCLIVLSLKNYDSSIFFLYLVHLSTPFITLYQMHFTVAIVYLKEEITHCYFRIFQHKRISTL